MSCVSTLTEPRLFNKVRAVSPLDVRVSSISDEVRVPQGNTTFASIRYVFSLYFYNQFNSTLAKTIDNLPWFNSIPTTSSEYWWGLDCVSGHSRWSSLMTSKSLTVHSWRSKSRQDRAQGISKDCQFDLESLLLKGKSKVFQTPSQSTMEFWKPWRGFCRLSKNHWR